MSKVPLYTRFSSDFLQSERSQHGTDHRSASAELGQVSSSAPELQGYRAHKKQPPPLGPP